MTRGFRPGALLAIATLFIVLQAHAAESYQFDIPEQALGKALKAFAEQSGLQIVYFTKIAEGHAAKAVVGALPAKEALDKLLENSGLKFEIVDDGTVEIRAVDTEVKGANVRHLDANESLVLASAEGDAPALSDQASTPSGSTRGNIAGRVVESGTSKAMPGAIVRVLETGQSTATDQLGNFSFTDIPPGDYTLSISYIGFADRLWRVAPSSEGNALEFTLEPSQWGLAEVTIFGNRSSRAIALNQQRTSDNLSDVVSADNLGNFTGTTVSESLRRVAGVSFQRNDFSGAGENIMIRGLEPDMNMVKLNGLVLPVGDGHNRSASLNNLLTDSISKITISKTLLASQDSAGTGGLVEIETKSPLDRPARYVNFAAEGGRRGGDFGNDYLLSGTVSRIFGSAKNFGVSASAQYTEARHVNTSFSNSSLQFGEYLPLAADGTPLISPFSLDPRVDFPYESGGSDDVFVDATSISLGRVDTSTLAVTLSGEWQPTANSKLRLDMQRSESTTSRFDSSGSLTLSSQYELRPVAALAGEERGALRYGGLAYAAQGYSLSKDDTSLTETYSLRGDVNPGKWQINYTLGFARGEDRAPNQYGLNLGYKSAPASLNGEDLDESDFLAGAVDPVEHLIISAFPRLTGKRVVLPLFRQATWDFFNTADNYYFGGANRGSTSGLNDRRSANLNTRYDFNWRAFEYLEAGVDLENSHYERNYSSDRYDPAYQVIEIPEFPGYDIIYPTLAPLGLEFGPTDLSRVGNSGEGFHYLDGQGVDDFIAHLDRYARDPAIISSVTHTAPSDLESRGFTEEHNVAAYLQGKLDFGKLDVIPGVRLSRVTTRAVAAAGPQIYDEFLQPDLEFAARFAFLQDESATVSDILPRVSVNYRQTDNLIFRGGYFFTTARPDLEMLRSSQIIELTLAGIFNERQALSVTEGNPALKAAVTHNFDLAAEYYNGDIGLIRLGGFYKRIVHSLQSNEYAHLQDLTGIELPDDPRFDGITAANTDITVTRPGNSEHPAIIWGAEVHVERQFTFLPGWWSGLGVYGNFTYTDSEKLESIIWTNPLGQQEVLTFPHERFNFQPATSGTAALTYNKRGIDATLSYSFQDRYQYRFTPNNLDQFTEGVRTLDLHVAYFFERGGMKWRTYVEGTDLLKGTKDSDLLSSWGGSGGIDKYYTNGTYLGGREIRVGVAATF